MTTEKETLKCESVFNEERTHRYMWKRVWNKDKPLACVIMINPCMADCIVMDTTTYLVVNNVASLEEYGGVEIVNLYSKLSRKLQLRWCSDEELFDENNETYIKKAAEESEVIILAWGTGVLSNNRILQRVNDVIATLKDYSNKLYVITDGKEARAVHPLTPSVRGQWILSAFSSDDIKVKIKEKKTKEKDLPPDDEVLNLLRENYQESSDDS